MEMTGGHALATMIARQGTQIAFGMGGFQLLPYYEGLRSLGVRHVLINDERTGAFAADAYARVANRPGVIDATLGPGATNLVTGLAESMNAGVPLIAITGNAHRGYAHRNMTQETRQVEVLRPVVKELLRVESLERVPEFVRRAFLTACTGRAGPVVIDVPEDVAHARHDYSEEDLRTEPGWATIPARRCRPDGDDIDRAAAMIASARRPIILAGGGIHLSGAHDALRAFCEKVQAPVVHTLSGKGALSCDHPLSYGLFGRYSRVANDLIDESDCIIAVGCKLGEIASKRYTIPPAHIPLIHLDIEPCEMGRWAPTSVALWGDCRLGLADLLAALPGQFVRTFAAEADALYGEWRKSARERYESPEVPINVGRIMGELNKALPADAILTVDGGFAGHWGGLLYDTKQARRGFVAGRGMASIGYGLPAAIGVKVAAPDRPVFAMTGDGGFNMSAGDLETAARMKLGLVLLVLNNAASGYIKALQHAMYGAGSYQSSDLSEIDYGAIARAYGCDGVRIDDPEQLGPAFRDALEPRDRPLVIDIAVTRDPAQMLPAADSRTLEIKPGDRPA